MRQAEAFHRYRRLAGENTTWKLLRAHNAPLILGFMSALFDGWVEVNIVEARELLNQYLALRDDEAEVSVDASVYLRDWIKDGYLQERENLLVMSDASQSALRFADNLSNREMTATASHLRLVQDAVGDLIVSMGDNYEERRAILEKRKEEINYQLVLLDKGLTPTLSDREKRERIREVNHLCQQLTGDFRYLEEQIQSLNLLVRQKMLENQSSRGEVIQEMLEREDLLQDSPSGEAFTAFYRLLIDETRGREFRAQLYAIVRSEAGRRFLSPQEQRFLGNLMRELGAESARIHERNRQTNASLRSFVASNALQENREIEEVLKTLARLAVDRAAAPDFRSASDISIHLNSGKPKFFSFDILEPAWPRPHQTGLEVRLVPKETTLTAEDLQRLRTVNLYPIAEAIKAVLTQHGPLTIAQITVHRPITEGLEELVGHLHIADRSGALVMEGGEWVDYTTRDGRAFRGHITRVVMRADDFPDDIKELRL